MLPNGYWTLSLCNKKLDFFSKPVSNLSNVINSNTSALIFSNISNHTLYEGNNDYSDIVNFKIHKAKPEMKIMHLFKVLSLNHGMTFQQYDSEIISYY